jgi:peptide/nickel transport system ATP-binding protein
LTPHRRIGALVRETAAAEFRVEAEMRALGLDPAYARRFPADLSGGERRRVALLRALSVRPLALILDEPTAELDRATAVDVVRTLLECQRRTRVAMLWITHDRSLAAAVTDRIVTLRDCRLC